MTVEPIPLPRHQNSIEAQGGSRMEKRMLDDATARAMTGGFVLVRGIEETHGGKGAGQGTVVIVIATGEPVTKTDGA